MSEKQTVNSEIKKINRSRIYQLLRQKGELTRQDILLNLRLSLPTVTKNLLQMEEEGIIASSGYVGNTGGRRAKTYSVVNNARIAIGLDITRNHITVVAVNLSGSVINRIRIRYKFELSESYYKKLGSLVEEIISMCQLDKDKILGVGIAVPGLITEDKQTVFYGKILNFTGVTCKELSQFIPLNCDFYNDANAAGFAEIWAYKDMKNVFYLMLSNNVGGSLLINNQVYTGENIRSGEVGHITIVPEGQSCYCGQKGCVDPYCAATVLSDITDGNLEQYFKLLNNKDSQAVKLWEKYLYYLAITVNNLRMLFDCKIILGGYVGAFMDDYIDDFKIYVASRNTFENSADFLHVCRYKTEAIAAGAALHYIDAFISNI